MSKHDLCSTLCDTLCNIHLWKIIKNPLFQIAARDTFRTYFRIYYARTFLVYKLKNSVNNKSVFLEPVNSFQVIILYGSAIMTLYCTTAPQLYFFIECTISKVFYRDTFTPPYWDRSLSPAPAPCLQDVMAPAPAPRATRPALLKLFPSWTWELLYAMVPERSQFFLTLPKYYWYLFRKC